MRFIHSCLWSSPYSTPPVPPTFALAPCPGPLTTPENSSRQLCESGGHKARMPVSGARHRPRLCNDPSGTAYEEHHGIYTFPTIPMSGKDTFIESVAIIAALSPKQRRSRVYPETTAFPHRLARRIPFCFRIRQNDGLGERILPRHVLSHEVHTLVVGEDVTGKNAFT